MSYSWGSSSRNYLKDVFCDLKFACDKVLKVHSTVDFGIIQSVRTVAEQRELVKNGNSHTMASRHIPVKTKTIAKYPRRSQRGKRADSRKWAFAVDIMCYLNGKPSWDSKLYYAVAEGFRIVAVKFDIPIRWGGCWKDLRKVGSIHTAVEEYKQWCKDQYKAGKRKNDRPFLDLGHFELYIRHYPKAK